MEVPEKVYLSPSTCNHLAFYPSVSAMFYNERISETDIEYVLPKENNGWIKITPETMPDKMEEVIASNINKKWVTTCYLDEFNNKSTWFKLEEDEEFGRIPVIPTHWMPLPSLPNK